MPYGFILNNPTSKHNYPIYVHNKRYVSGQVKEPRSVLVTYIKYSLNYTTVTGTQRKGQPECNIPVMVGRRSQSYSIIMPEQWKSLQRDTNSEFSVNEALAELGDINLVGCYVTIGMFT